MVVKIGVGQPAVLLEVLVFFQTRTTHNVCPALEARAPRAPRSPPRVFLHRVLKYLQRDQAL